MIRKIYENESSKEGIWSVEKIKRYLLRPGLGYPQIFGHLELAGI
jgi:hypothetical protein